MQLVKAWRSPSLVRDRPIDKRLRRRKGSITSILDIIRPDPVRTNGPTPYFIALQQEIERRGGAEQISRNEVQEAKEGNKKLLMLIYRQFTITMYNSRCGSPARAGMDLRL